MQKIQLQKQKRSKKQCYKLKDIKGINKQKETQSGGYGMSEAKNIFAILDELKGNAKQIDNEARMVCCRSLRLFRQELLRKESLLEVQGVQDLQQEDFQTD